MTKKEKRPKLTQKEQESESKTGRTKGRCSTKEPGDDTKTGGRNVVVC